uniref:Uncharacterized protein n=1 Tax=Arundo donax TaxID=35708 RepID=A0A0A9BAN4_ARUDO
MTLVLVLFPTLQPHLGRN